MSDTLFGIIAILLIAGLIVWIMLLRPWWFDKTHDKPRPQRRLGDRNEH